ncbi:protocadherin-12 isoform X2 [Thalassophryne amazonica]|uniref:protocadherin-12 isoform X2 n=1 Tax=Thalassophryne amazonica TaxID=390379 RepID=UPI00147087DB|nr:protocadherin-12 isoform X2 [Thalassophryne amazonica]
MLPALVLVLSLASEVRSFEPSSVDFQYRVWEEQPAGTLVGRLVDDLRQRDEGGSLEDFQVVEHGHTLPFSVGVRDGVISTQSRLDREELCRGSNLCELAFSVLYRKNGAVNCLRVHVEVMDLNDHSPTFPSALQELEVSETVGLQMRIPLDRAVDPDAGPNSLQTYSLSINTHFDLDVTTAPGGTKQAELVVIKELDREVQAHFELTLTAWDKGNPPRSGSTLIHVNILDSNDNSPVFEDSIHTMELSEDTPRGTTIINLKATDPDQGANGEVVYSVSKHTHPEVQRLFTVDPQTGAVTLRGPLDYEAESSFEVIIQARDQGPNAIPSHCKLHIKLKDVNDNAPRVHMTWTPPNSPGATVLEGAAENTFLALVMVSDADSGNNGKVSAYIQQGSGPFTLKKIHGDNYMIMTNGSLDREQVMRYNLTLVAQDYGDPPLSCVKHLPVLVLDENDNAPIFSSHIYKASFKENNVIGYHALRVEADDMDLQLSGRVSYFIQNSEDMESPVVNFSIHPTSGVISVQRSLDYEESHTYSLIVEAVDHGHPPLTSTATVHINIQDENDNYPVIKEPKPRNGVALVSVPVDTDKGEIVSELRAEDVEEGSTNLPVIPSVKGGLLRFLASTIKAEDADSGLNGQLRYIISGQHPGGLFWLDHVTGHLFVNTTNATELIGQTFKVDIVVADLGSPSLVSKVTFQVTFINLKDHLKNSSPSNRGQLSFTMVMVICLSATCLLVFLTITLVTTICRPEKRDNRAYNCRQAESSYTRHPRRPQKNIRKSDIQIIPVIRGRKEEPQEEDGETKALAPPPLISEDQQTKSQYRLMTSVIDSSFQYQDYTEREADLPISNHGRTLQKPGNIKLNGTFPVTPTTSYPTLRKPRNSSSSSFLSQSSTLKCPNNPERDQVGPPCSASQTTPRRPKTSEGHGEQEVMLQNLVRLSIAAFENAIELSAASPEVQISQLLSLLRQGQLQPRPNFRGNKYSHRRFGGQDCSDWQSTKDSGHGESEAGDVDWEPGRDSPVDLQLEEGLNHLLSNTDDVFSDGGDPAWMARLSLPLAGNYHDNVFVPNGPPSTDSELLPRDGLDSSSFSTFGKALDKDSPLGGALLSEVSTLFEMLMTQKADTHPGPRPDVLYRLSAAYRRSLGLEGANSTAGNAPRNTGKTDQKLCLAPPTGFYQ